AVDPTGKVTKEKLNIEVDMGDKNASLSEKLFQQFNTMARNMENEISKEFRTRAYALSSGAVKAAINVVGHMNDFTGVAGWTQSEIFGISDLQDINEMLDNLEGFDCPA